MNRTWNFLSNPFEVATADSYLAMKKICNFTLDAIKGQCSPTTEWPTDNTNQTFGPNTEWTKGSTPFFNHLFNTLCPIVENFNNCFNECFGNGTVNPKPTRVVNTLALLRGVKIQDWDLAIQNVYREGTPGYSRLLPNFRTPFQHGTHRDRINAVETLDTNVAEDTFLPQSLKDDIHNFLLQLHNDVKTTVTENTGTQCNTEALEMSRKELCTCLYGCLGSMMTFFQTEPWKIANFFDLETLRNHEQTIFRCRVNGTTPTCVFTHRFTTEDTVHIVNDGNCTLKFFLCRNVGDTPGSKFVTIPAGGEQVVKCTDLGDITNRCFCVCCDTTKNNGQCTVTLC